MKVNIKMKIETTVSYDYQVFQGINGVGYHIGTGTNKEVAMKMAKDRQQTVIFKEGWKPEMAVVFAGRVIAKF